MAMGKAEEVVEVINSKGCSTLFSSASTSRSSPSSQITESSMSPSSSSSCSGVRANGPFASLVICVTGLSKEARKQVNDATERLGGQYSPSLHPRCTHLVVQSFHGRKFDHALKHGPRNGLFVVNLGWFVDSIRKNVRLNESLYSVKSVVKGGLRVESNHLIRISDTEKSCAPVGLHEDTREPNTYEQENPPSGENSGTSRNLVLSGHSIYLDPDISDDVKTKVVDAASKGGIVIINSWFAGCGAAHVVCEGHSTWRYFGHTDSIVTPQWILKTIKENYVQRLVHMSADLARQVSGIVENYQNVIGLPEQRSMEHPTYTESRPTLEERQQIVDKAKSGVRSRRRHLQARKAQIRPITPSTLMDSICWSISDPTSAACVYTDTSEFEDHSESTSLRTDPRVSEASFENLCRPLSESEKSEKILKNHFVTILFPMDRSGEMGPCSRTFFSETGFTCLQLLDYVNKFYQENMSEDEVNNAIHTDSKHADRLRSCYASSKGCEFKRIEFLGTRRSFEMLKRVCGDSSSNVYELLIRA